MIRRLRDLLRKPGPIGALALGALVGVVTGLLALNVVLAGWTYRNAARRDLRAPGRWALAVLFAGPLAFVPYAALQWYRDRSKGADSRGAGQARDRTSEPAAPTDEVETSAGGLEAPTGRVDGPGGVEGSSDRTKRSAAGVAGSADRMESAAVERGEANRRSASLARAGVRFGGKAAALGVRGARWAGRRAAARMNNG